MKTIAKKGDDNSMKRYIMEYLEKSRTQRVIFANSLKEAKQKAKEIAKINGITEYYVYAD